DRSASAALVAQTASLRPRHLPVAVTLRDPALEQMASARPATELVAFERAAAEALMLARSEAIDQMRRQGVVVLDVAPGGAGVAVVKGYHHLKRRVLLRSGGGAGRPPSGRHEDSAGGIGGRKGIDACGVELGSGHPAQLSQRVI